MTKQAKNIYRILAWILTAIVASGTLIGCRKPTDNAPKYGPATYKYGPPIVRDINKIDEKKV
jgi:hypothetical protein